MFQPINIIFTKPPLKEKVKKKLITLRYFILVIKPALKKMTKSGKEYY